MQRHEVEGPKPDPDDDKNRKRRRTTVVLLAIIAGLLAGQAEELWRGKT